MFCTSSVLIRPGFIRVFQTFAGNAVVMISVPFFSGTGSVNRYGIYSEVSCRECKCSFLCRGIS